MTVELSTALQNNDETKQQTMGATINNESTKTELLL